MTSIDGMAPVRPVYIFAKPPAEIAHRIARQRQLLGIDSGYPEDRFHLTVLRLGERDALPANALALFERTVAALHVEPAAIRFERMRGNALRCARTGEIRALHKRLATGLVAAGLEFSQQGFDPHLTLVYGKSPLPPAAIPPIGWLVEEIMLVVSHHGKGRHEVLCRWAA